MVDAARERRPPFSPEDVVAEFAALLKAYRIGSVKGDRYGGEWPRERFRTHGIEYDLAEKPKSDLYRDVLPALNSGRVELLDNARQVTQLCSLERRTARGGRDSIDHAPGAHDDVANVVAGVIVSALGNSVAGWGMIEYMRQLVAGDKGVPETAPFGWATAANAARPTIKLRAPAGISNITGMFGKSYLVGADGIVEVDEQDAKPLLAAGFSEVFTADQTRNAA